MAITGGAPRIFNLQDVSQNPAQQGYLHSFLYRNNFIAGRGSGKTVIAVAKNAIYSTLEPRQLSYITEQTGPMVTDTLLPVFREIIPSELFKIRVRSSNSYDIEWANGHQTRLRSRQVRNSIEDPPFRGPSAGQIIHDEAALDRNGQKIMDISEGMLRGSELLCLDCISTPKIGWFYDYMQRHGLAGDAPEQISADGKAAAFYGRTSDNPYNNDLDSRLRESYGEQFAAQELDAMWVALSGRIWDRFDESKQWPQGNVHWAKWSPSQPYYLAVDLGVRSAWSIIQRHPGEDRVGNKVQRAHVDVLVAEHVPNHGNARDMVRMIAEQYGRPVKVIVGADINTRSITDGMKPSYFFSSAWPGIEIQIPSKYARDKEIQHWIAQGRICNAHGQRGFCISEHLQSDSETTGRGFLDMIRTDAWPDGVARTAQFFEKDKSSGGPGIEDTRDAFLYWCACEYPPDFRGEFRTTTG